MDWPMVALREVLTFAPDPVAVSPEKSYPNIGVYGFGRGVITKPHLVGSEIKARTLYRVVPGQFIYSKLKAFEGAFASVPIECGEYFVSNEFPNFDVDTSRVDIRFIEWLFRNPDTWKALAVKGKGMGARRERVHPNRILDFHIPLPPLAEQRRIADRLDRVAALVAERRRAAEVAGREARALLLAEFVRAIDGAPRRPMRDVAPLVRRPVEVNPDGIYPELGVRSFGRGVFHKSNLIGAELTWQKLFRVKSGDLIFSNIKAWEGAFAVASEADDERVGSHRYLTCVPQPGIITADFVCFHLQTETGMLSVQKASPGSADRNRTLGQKALGAIEVPVPPIARQLEFDALQARFGEIAAIRARAETHLNALLPALFHEVFSDVSP